MDPNKAYEIGRQGDEQRFRSLIQDALSEGHEEIANWLFNKVRAAHPGSYKDIIEEAVEYANTESETYKPTDLAKKYWAQVFPEEPNDDHFEVPRAGSPEHLAFIEKQNPGTLEKWVSNIMKKDAERQDLLEPDEDSKKMAADIQAKLNKAATDEKINMASGAEPTPTPRPLSSDDEWGDDYNKKHEGFEKQAEGLDNLLEGLRDTPHDNRW